MKTNLVTLLGVLLFFSIGLHAQKSKKKNRTYMVWVSKIDNSKKIKGLLHEVNNESLKIIDRHSKEINIDASNIEIIKIRRKGKIVRGAWIGAASGAVFGVIFGLIADDEDTNEGLVATGGGLAFGILGTGVGIVVGANKKKVKINGETSLYKDNLEFLQSISLVTNNSMKNNK